VDTTTTQVGSILESPHSYTLDEGWRAKWFAHFPTSDVVLTSQPAAEAFGFDERPLPFSLLLNLCLCLSVEPFSQTCRYHLGLRDARQIAPVRLGDTVRARIRVEALRNTSGGDAAVIVTTHILVNQRGEAVFALTKDSYYAAIPGLDGRPALERNGADHALFDAALAAQARSGAGKRVDNGAFIPPSFPVEAGEVILHPAVRPIGWSENLELTTLVRNTHPIHFDAQRYGREGIVVCGGFVQALVQGLASPEFRQVIEERLIHSFHTGTVMPEDRIGALSRVLEVRDLGDGTEEVVVSTLGLINVDVEQELIGVAIPDALFGPEPVKPAALRALCAEHCPVLENRVALRAIRVLRRVKP
jgi:acyl dehydratase